MNNLQKISISLFLSEFTTSAYFIIVTWILYHSTNNAIFTGLFIGLGFLPSFLSNLYFGVLVDRMEKRHLLIIAQSIISISLILIALLTYGDFPFLVIGLILIHMIIQLCGSLFRPSMQAYLTSIFSQEELITVFSKTASIGIVGSIAGTALGSLFISLFPAAIVFLILLCPLLLSLFLLRSLPVERVEIITSPNSIVKDIKNGFHYCFSDKFYIQLLIIMAIGQLIFHTNIGFLAVFTTDILKENATIYGILEILCSLGGVISGWYAKSLIKRIGIHFSNVIIILLMVALYLMFTAVNILIVSIACFMLGLVTTWLRTTFQAIQQSATTKGYHGRVASIRMFFNQGFVIVVSPIFGYVSDAHSVSLIYIILMIISVVCLLTSILIIKDQRFRNIIRMQQDT